MYTPEEKIEKLNYIFDTNAKATYFLYQRALSKNDKDDAQYQLHKFLFFRDTKGLLNDDDNLKEVFDMAVAIDEILETDAQEE